MHPGSRGRTCAKGPATINQVKDTERILTPLKRSGPRGSGKFEPCSWDEVVEKLGARIRKALDEERHDEITLALAEREREEALLTTIAS